MSEEKSKIAREKKRSDTGKFVKGVSGNPKGRPKKEEIQARKSGLPDNFHEYVGTDAKKAFEKLLETTTDRYEAAKIADKLIKYQHPTLSSVESYATEIKTIEIKWLTDSDPTPIIDSSIEPDLLEGNTSE